MEVVMDMNKKTWYWAIGIIAALLVIFLFWGMFQDKPAKPQMTPAETPATSQTESSVSADSDYTRYMEEETAIMDRMMRDMELTEETDNSALDFIAGMIPHHEAAVSMAESYLNHGGSHSQLKPLAENIITAQKSEIAQMEEMQKKISESGRTDSQQAAAYREAYEKMMAAHHEDHSSMSHDSMNHNSINHDSMNHSTMEHGSSVDASTPIDTAFAEGMIMHHQMAVDMAKAILDNTDEQELLELAQQIIADQEEEITQMQKVLDQQ